MTRKTYSRAKKFFRAGVKYVLGLLSATVIATLSALPVTYLLFGGISIISPISNLILVPLSQVLLYLLALLCVLFNVPFIGAGLAFAAKRLILLICRLAGHQNILPSLGRYPFHPSICDQNPIFASFGEQKTSG